MQIKLSQKEKFLLEDGKAQEELCIKKYKEYANKVQDVQLKNLLMEIAQEEEHHLDMINQMLQGQAPNMAHTGTAGGGGSSNVQIDNTFEPQDGSINDKLLLTDLLSTEKHVSSLYDTLVFESAEPQIRKAIQHIQQDEQAHGEKIFNYMNQHGMYDVQY